MPDDDVTGDCSNCGGQIVFTRNRIGGPYEWVHLSGGIRACPARTYADPGTPAPAPAHTLTMGDVDDGHVEWKLHCNHDMATWGHYDIETGEYTEADGCWLQSWWGEMGGELLSLKSPVPPCPIPVRPAAGWDDDGGVIVLDLGHLFVGPAPTGTDLSDAIEPCTECGRARIDHA